MSQSQIIFGFHPIISQLRQSSRSIQEIYLDSDRNDPRAKEIIELAKENNILLLEDALYRRTLILEANQYTLGRHSSNNIQMHSKQASRKHATLLRKFNSKTNQEVFWIIDGDLDGNKSQNGMENFKER